MKEPCSTPHFYVKKKGKKKKKKTTTTTKKKKKKTKIFKKIDRKPERVVYAKGEPKQRVREKMQR